MSSENLTELDPLDIKLITELEGDARQTYISMANNLSMARSTVAVRVQRLLDNNIVKMVCWADPLALGYKLVVSFGISTQPGYVTEVATRLAAYPPILEVHLCSGRFDIVAWAVFRDNDEFINFLSNELKSISGIVQIDKMLTLREVKVSWRLLKNEKQVHRLRRRTKELDDLDISLIRELQINPRQRADLLARKFELYNGTIRRRIQRLVDEKIIRFIAVTDPAILGYECSARIGIKCTPDKIREIAEAVASHNNIQYVSICAGVYEIDTIGVFKKFNDLENFISVELGSIAGLVSLETSVNHKAVKIFTGIPV